MVSMAGSSPRALAATSHWHGAGQSVCMTMIPLIACYISFPSGIHSLQSESQHRPIALVPFLFSLPLPTGRRTAISLAPVDLAASRVFVSSSGGGECLGGGGGGEL